MSYSTRKFFLLALFVIGTVLALLLPPFQKPDEYVHFHKAAAIASGTVFCSNSVENTALIPRGYLELEELMHTYGLEHHEFAKFPWRQYLRSPFASKEEQMMVAINIDQTCSWPPLGYLPQGLVLKFTQLLQLSPLISFFLGRLAMLGLAFGVFYLLVTHLATPALLLFVLTLPITLHQLGAYGSDSLHLTFGFTFILSTLALLPRPRLSPLSLSALALLFALFCLTKPGYEPFVLLPVIILWGKPINRPSSPLSLFLLSLAGLLFIWHLGRTYFSLGAVTDSMSLPYANPSLQLQYLLTHPAFAWSTLSDTTTRSLGEYLNQLVGKFGWLDYWLGPYLYPLYFASFGFVVAKLKLRKIELLSPPRLILLILWLVASYSLIMFSQYLIWTSVGSPYIEGIQGRYFLVLVPILLYLAVAIFHHPKLAKVVGLGLALLVAGNLVSRTLTRYYDYSQLFRVELLSLPTETTSTPIDSRLVIPLDLTGDLGHKLGGVALGLANPNLAVTTPYLFTLMDQDCQHLLREQFIDLVAVPQGIYEATFPPLTVSSPGNYCLALEPYGGLTGTALQLLSFWGNSPVLVPLILR